MICCLLLFAGLTSALFAAPDYWPTNPYWVHSPPPIGPGHKIQIDGLLKKCDKDFLGIKVNIKDPEVGFLGTVEVADELSWRVVMGDLKSRLSLNHKGNAGAFKSTVHWMDKDGKEDRAEAVKPGCG